MSWQAIAGIVLGLGMLVLRLLAKRRELPPEAFDNASLQLAVVAGNQGKVAIDGLSEAGICAWIERDPQDQSKAWLCIDAEDKERADDVLQQLFTPDSN